MPPLVIAMPELNAAVFNHSIEVTRSDLLKPDGVKLLVSWRNPFARPVTNGAIRLHASTNAGLQLLDENIPVHTNAAADICCLAVICLVSHHLMLCVRWKQAGNVKGHAALQITRRISAAEFEAGDTRVVVSANFVSDQVVANGFVTVLLVGAESV